ncbi:ACH96175.1 GrBNV gp23-like protein [Kallithea virus]|uniref:ACH96175.1 GrBNV gp23-like protein n=1 Tax=Kallithea virus TaxID=1654582 RepID=A0A1S5VG17_9VIRU|nr:ACH96175.1 GrBNV gp23-like protein [Kallithea virus]AQN78589.1 ACH96175.1 GrBNV gp23-like protein [Kallithea virus]
MADKKIFNEETKSRLVDLYSNDFEKIVKQNASVNLYNNDVTYLKIQRSMAHQPDVEICNKSCLLDLDNFDFNAMNRAAACLNLVPKSNETVVIEMCLVEKKPNVRFLHSNPSDVGKKNRLLPPRFVIDLDGFDIKPNQGVRVNTGYIVKIPQIAMGKSIKNNEIVNTKMMPQLDVVIIPQIVSKHAGIIPTLYGRDAEDTGLLTINFTTTKDFNPKTSLQVVLNAYHCIRPINSANLINQENKTAVLFKPKDSRSGRWVKNPKIKFCADRFDLKTCPGSLLLDTYDHTKKPIEMYPDQKIKIANIITLFTSRKREWFNPKLVTFAGIYNPNDGSKNSHSGLIAGRSEIINNTHGVVFIKSKITAISVVGTFSEDCRIVNGSFSNLKNYDDIVKRTRQITAALKGLSVGAKACRQIIVKNPDIKIEDLLRVYDYHRSINAEDPQLNEKLKMSDEKLFDSRPSTQNAYSANIYKCLKILAYNFCASDFNEKQLAELSLYSNTVSTKATVNGVEVYNNAPMDEINNVESSDGQNSKSPSNYDDNSNISPISPSLLIDSKSSSSSSSLPLDVPMEMDSPEAISKQSSSSFSVKRVASDGGDVLINNPEIIKTGDDDPINKCQQSKRLKME